MGNFGKILQRFSRLVLLLKYGSLFHNSSCCFSTESEITICKIKREYEDKPT